jgi:hypothetical protein
VNGEKKTCNKRTVETGKNRKINKNNIRKINKRATGKRIDKDKNTRKRKIRKIYKIRLRNASKANHVDRFKEIYGR